MIAMGLLDAELRPSDRFTTDVSEPVRPGTDSVNLIKTNRGNREQESHASFNKRLLADAEANRDDALDRAQSTPNCITWARLATAHLTLDEVDEGLQAARACLDRAHVEAGDSGDIDGVNLTSIRMAARILRDHGDAAYAYDRLVGAGTSRTLTVTVATLANELGRPQEAMDILDGQEGPLVESFRGYLLALLGSHQRAIGHLRAALAQEPSNADAVMNLGIVLWAMGSRKKGLKNALRATRTAPGRKDMSLRYLELLLEAGQPDDAAAEVSRLNRAGVIADAQFLVVQARVLLAKNHEGKDQKAKALSLLDQAQTEAKAEQNVVLEGEIAANRETLRYDLGRVSRSAARRALVALMEQFPDNDAVLINYCYLAQRRSEATELRRTFERQESLLPPDRREYVRHQLALLEGDSEQAADAATDWFSHAHDNPSAVAAAVTSLGIGMQRWEEALKVAEYALARHADSDSDSDPMLINNVAYTLAMAGRAEEAKRLLKPVMNESFVLRATFGLAHLANGEIEAGMRFYREAAELAERVDEEAKRSGIDNAARCLMTLYQALIVRQLGLDETVDRKMLDAIALAPVPLPEDWEDRPEFLRLRNNCIQNGYDWPLHI